MKTQESTIKPSPPRLIPSLTAGFNAVANNIYIILFPVLLDLFLWFGPHIRLRSLVQPIIVGALRSMEDPYYPDMADIIETSQEAWTLALEQFNLAVTLRTYPVGVPSLLSSEGTLLNPLGEVIFYEIPSILSIIGIWILFSLLGLVVGSLFFNEVSRLSDDKRRTFSLENTVWQIIQILGLTISIYLMLVIISIPLSLIVSLFVVVNAFLAQAALFCISLLFIWFLLPLIFSPHGIFERHDNFLVSLVTSAKIVRHTLPGTGMFIFVLLLLSQGMDYLWQIPPETSWLKFVGISGHAFVSTSLLAASFIYYRKGITWMEEKQEKLKSLQHQPPEKQA